MARRRDAEAETLGMQPPSIASIQVLQKLQRKHVYAGTADPDRVARDRVRNKTARKSARRNRKKG